MNKIPLPRQFALDLSHTPPASLDNFLPGKDLALLGTLRNLTQAWLTKANEELQTNPLNERWIYWWGPEGSGRSHLLKALSNAAQISGLEHFDLTPSEPISWVRLEEKMPLLSQSKLPSVITVDDVDRFSATPLSRGRRGISRFIFG